MKELAGNFGVGFEAQANPQQRVEAQERVLQLLDLTVGPDDPRSASALGRMGVLLREAGQLEPAQLVGKDAYEQLARALGEDHPLALAAGSDLGLTMLAAGRLFDAEQLLRGVYDRASELLGADSPLAAAALANLALALRARGDLEGALRMQGQAVTTLRESYDDLGPAVIRAEVNLASLLAATRQTDLARQLLEALRERLAQQYGVSHAWVLGMDASLGAAYRQAGDIGASRRALDGVYSRLEPILGPEHPSTLGLAADLAVTLGESDAPEDGARAIQLGEQVVRGRTESLGASHPQTVHAMRYLARAASGHDDKLALDMAQEAATLSEKTLGRAHPDTLQAYDELAGTLERGQQSEPAKEVRLQNAEVVEADEGIVSASPPAVENLAGALGASDAFVEGEVPQLGMPVVMADGPSEVLARTAHAELDPPRPIKAGEDFSVVVFLGSFEAGTRPGEAPVIVEAPAGVDTVVLDVWLVTTRHFEIVSEAVLQLELYRERETSDTVRFQLRAASTLDEFPEDPELRILFSYQGWPSGEVRLPVLLLAEEVV